MERPEPLRGRKPAAAARHADNLEAAFEHACESGTAEDFRAWTARIRSLAGKRRLFRPESAESLRDLAALLKLQLARPPPSCLAAACAAPAVVAFARELESLREPGLSRRAHALVAMLAGRLGIRGWSGRRDQTLLSAFDRAFQDLIRRPRKEHFEGWLVLLHAAELTPEAMRAEREFAFAHAGKMLACALVAPASWLSRRKRFGGCLSRLAEGLVRAKDPDLAALGCEIATTVADRAASAAENEPAP